MVPENWDDRSVVVLSIPNHVVENPLDLICGRRLEKLLDMN